MANTTIQVSKRRIERSDGVSWDLLEEPRRYRKHAETGPDYKVRAICHMQGHAPRKVDLFLSSAEYLAWLMT